MTSIGLVFVVAARYAIECVHLSLPWSHRRDRATLERARRRQTGKTKWVKGGKSDDDRPTATVAVDAASKAAESNREIRVYRTAAAVVVVISFCPEGLLRSPLSAAGVNTPLQDREIIRTEREREREGNLWGKQQRQLREKERERERENYRRRKKKEWREREAMIEIEAGSDVGCAADLLGRFLLLKVHFYLKKKSLSLSAVSASDNDKWKEEGRGKDGRTGLGEDARSTRQKATHFLIVIVCPSLRPCVWALSASAAPSFSPPLSRHRATRHQQVR